MRKSLVFAAAVTAAAMPCVVFAAHRVPGEWEITSQSHFIQGGMQIPPEIRAQMKARGMKMPDISAPHTYKKCLTPEDAIKDEHPVTSDQSCTVQNAHWSGNQYHAEVTCNEQGGSGHGVIDGSLSAGGRQFSGTGRVEGDAPMLGGHFVMEFHSSGKWLGPTCGKNAE